MKKGLIFILVAMLAFSLVACGGGGDSDTSGGTKVGVSMPTQSLQRWNQDGAYMKEKLEEAGYEVELQFANDEPSMQVSQLENMVASDCQVLVVSAIDSEVLSTVLTDAIDKGISVIAYDRLIMGNVKVSYYATFDNWLVGRMQGEYIETALDLKNADGPFNIELFTGSPDDNNINFFFGGAMEVLQPYVDSGKLVVLSDQTDKLQVATEGWKSENAQKRMEDLIMAQGYGPKGTKLDAVMCSNDSTAQGVTTALAAAGYTAENFPIITGQDCDKPSVINMLNGQQSMSVFKDTRTLAARVVLMVDAIMKGETPEINDEKTYSNDSGVIPSFLCDPVVCTVDNIQEILVDSGYYKPEDIGL
jgi:ABC-type xylose transport system, periplasmic component